MEVLHPAKYLEENFLSGIGRIGRIGQDAVNQAVNRLMEFPDQPGVGFF